jgi:hypothetical protein
MTGADTHEALDGALDCPALALALPAPGQVIFHTRAFFRGEFTVGSQH